MPGPLAEAKERARILMRTAAMRSVFGLVGLICFFVGLGCMTAALWIVIALHQGAIAAFAFIGVIYLGIGGVFLALATYSSSHRHRARRYEHPVAPAPSDPYVRLAEAFATGVQAGRAARKR